MPYLMIDDFAAGIDLRKSALTAPPGTLRALTNATITAGGEIEKRKTLTAFANLPPGTHGVAFEGTALTVFGTAAPGAIGPMPSYVNYQQLVPSPSGPTIQRVLDVQVFAGKFYVVARMSDATVRHFYDGVQVADAGAQGSAVRAHKKKLFAVQGQNLRFSAILNATQWTTGTGSGIIDVTTEDAGETELVGLEEYYGSLAVFGRTSVQIWAMDPDPNLSQIQQVLGNTGLVTRNAVARFGSGDVLFLADTGIRSLRARDIQSAAAVNDVGAPVDNLIAPRRAALTSADADRIAALVDPLTGHFWLTWGSDVIALTTYPNSKISAWSVLSFPVTIDYICTAGSRIVVRSGDFLFLYGSTAGGNPFDPNTPIGVSAALYDASVVDLETPFLPAGMPATEKVWTGLDVSCTGTWDVFVCPSPPPPEQVDQTPTWTKIATVTGATWNRGRIPIDMAGTHIAVKMQSVGAGPATLAAMALHYEQGESG